MDHPKRRSLPKSVKDMSKGEIEEALKKKKECDAKALQIVVVMLDNPVNEEWFMDSLNYIRQTHFDDIVDERAILKICGYPLCCGTLKNVSSHQYRISLRHNKVYDVTERNKFCSNQCYRAGKYLKDQLLTSPLWFHSYEVMPSFKLLPIHSTGMIGEEVNMGISVLVENESMGKGRTHTDTPKAVATSTFKTDTFNEVCVQNSDKSDQGLSVSKVKEVQPHNTTHNIACTNIKKNDTTELFVQGNFEIHSGSQDDNQVNHRQMSCEDSSDKTIKHEGKTSLNVNLKNKCEPKGVNFDSVEKVNVESRVSGENVNAKASSKLVSKSKIIESVITDQPGHKLHSSHNSDESVKTNLIKSKGIVSNLDCFNSNSFVFHVETCLREWVNIETLIFLLGERKVKDMIVDKGESIKEYYKVISNNSWDPKMQERFESICKRLNVIEIEDNQYDHNVVSTTKELKPLPDYSIIQQEGKKLEIKVNAFYKGKTSYTEATHSEKEGTSDELTPDPLLPLVDTHAQKCYRRKIVLDRLNKVVPDFLRTFGLTSQDYYSEFRELVRTFSLEADNIIFKPVEWNLLGLIIINMLALKDEKLKDQLKKDRAKNYQTLMLIPYQQDSGYIAKLISWLTNIDNFIDTPKGQQ